MQDKDLLPGGRTKEGQRWPRTGENKAVQSLNFLARNRNAEPTVE
jgi:hypothetical protein